MVQVVNQATTVPGPTSKYTPKNLRTRLITPTSEDTRWLSEEISRFTKWMVLWAGSQAELARRTKVNPATIMKMLNGELVNLRTIALLANAAKVQVSLTPLRFRRPR